MRKNNAYIYFPFIILIACIITSSPYSRLEANESSLIGNNKNTRALILLEPLNRSKLKTVTPTFKWQEVKGDSIEYRFILAAWNGKIIVDQWVGSDTNFVISDPNLLSDLNIYLWSVSVYEGSHHIQSITNSFWIDLDVSFDLEITNLKLIANKYKWHASDHVRFEVEVLNCGPSTCFNPKVLLCNGNVNNNYYGIYAFRKTQVLDSIIIKRLDSGMSYKVELQGKISHGLNHFYAEVKTDKGYFDLYPKNNSIAGSTIQTINNNWLLRGLFVIYANYKDRESGIQKINKAELSSITNNITNTQQFFWDHTHIIKIEADTLHINRILTDNDFTYVDDKWGYVLGPWDIEYDLIKRGITENEYDFIFVYYAWHNSIYSWSGYNGYTYKEVLDGLGLSAFAAQPIIPKVLGTEKITIHEILHIIDYFYEEGGNEDFYSPNEKERYTTFVDELAYYEWMLETWPTSAWFTLNWGKKITPTDVNNYYIDQLPQTLSLYQNYPNPFNNSTVITYELPGKNSFSKECHVTLIIYSLLGGRVCTLVDDYKEPGVYSVSWNGYNDSGESVSSGIYFYKINAGDQSLTKKLLLIK